MTGHGERTVTLLDGGTAATLSQVLPLLLLTLVVEVRRTQLHRSVSRIRLAVFFLMFGTIETILVLSIDGALYRFKWFDICSALLIFGLLAAIFRLSLADSRQTPADD